MPPVSGVAAVGGDLTNLNNGTVIPSGWLVTATRRPGRSDRHRRDADDRAGRSIGVADPGRHPPGSAEQLDANTVMVFAVTDKETGEVLGLFRMPDSTIFSIDVAVAKARNVAYYADPTQLQPIDQLPGILPGTAFTNRTFRYLVEPFFPEGIDGAPPGPFSILNDTPRQSRRTLKHSAPRYLRTHYTSVYGHDAFFPETNFRDPFNPDNQNGIVFFPGSSGLYKFGNVLVGSLSASRATASIRTTWSRTRRSRASERFRQCDDG